MPTMQQLTYVKARQLEWWEVAKPKIEKADDAILRPIAVARCDLDYYIVIGAYRTPGPFALGHEMVAVVTEIGDAVTQFKPGDKVIVPFQISCGACTNCVRGWTNACMSMPPLAAYGLGTHPDGEYGGALSDFVRVPFADQMLVALPESLTPEAACGLSDNVADGYRTVAEGLSRFPGEPVLIVGGLAQSVGLYAVYAALALGSKQVVYTDFDDVRLSMATKAGAEAIKVDYAQSTAIDAEYLITVDASAMTSGLAYAIKSTAACGYCIGVSASSAPTTALPLSSAYLKGITYNVSRVHGRQLLPTVLLHTCAGHIDPLAFVDNTYRFDQAAEAMFDPSPKIIFSKA
jgi:threonine dehydrogenase-like Zn-dependent dehydrogenase